METKDRTNADVLNDILASDETAEVDETPEDEAEGADNGDAEARDEDLLEDETEDGGESEETAEEDEEDGEELVYDEGDEAPEGKNPLALDPKVAAKLTPEERKRYDQQAAGLLKLRTKLEADEKTLGSYREWDKALNAKETAADALRNLVEGVAKAHGFDPKDFLGKAKAEPDEDPENGFEYESDRAVYAKAKADAVREMTEKLGFDPAEVKAFIDSQKTTAQKAQAEKAVDELLPKVVKTLKAKFNGWTPDKAQVRAALLKGDLKKPIGSVKTALVDDLVAHTAKKSRAEAGPERLRGGKAPGKQLSNDPLAASALDYVEA